MDERDQFGGAPWQGRPKGGYWLPKEFHLWPEIRMVGLGPLGAFVTLGVQASRFDTTDVPKGAFRASGVSGMIEPLERHRLLTRASAETWRIATIGGLRQGRGTRGLIMRVSQHVPQSVEMTQAGHAALGLWVLAASWSLTTTTPGHIPSDVALQFGRPKLVSKLWDAGAWIVTEHGFLMHKRDHPREAWWDIARDDERADIAPELRQRVYDRDGWRCVECGSPDDLSLDHIFPWSRGGSDEYENLRTLCRPCNSSKGARVE